MMATLKGVPCEAYSFASLCHVLGKIAEAKAPKRQDLLNHLWATVSGGESLYPVLRLLLPHLDLKRSSYQLREKRMAEIFIRALGIPERNADAQSLLHYTDPSKVRQSAEQPKVVGTFSDVVYKVLSGRLPASPDGARLSVGEVNRVLDELADAVTTHERREEIFRQVVLRRMSPDEIRWFVRIMCKDLKIGVKHEQMLRWLYLAPKGSSDALELWNCRTDLEEVCLWVLNPVDLGAIISPMNAVKPMLSKKAGNEKALRKLLGSAQWKAETKFDGERMMVHVQNGRVKLFSRNCHDYTNKYQYGDAFKEIAPSIKATDCILDGEVMAYNTETKRFEPFGQNRAAAHAGASGHNRRVESDDDGGDNDVGGADRGERMPGADGDHDDERVKAASSSGNIRLCYMAFDCIYRDGKSLMSRSLSERRVNLTECVQQSDRLRIVEQSDVYGFDAVMRKLEEAVESGNEGIILKNADSNYAPGDRGERWLKLKPDYYDGHATMDLIVLGGFYGEGSRRSGDISHFLMGVAERSVAGGEPTQFRTICKVGTGYSLVDLDELLQRLKPHWKLFKPGHSYAHLVGWAPTGDSIPDRIIEPRNSVVFQVKAYELWKVGPTSTASMTALVTLRFPRVEAIRYDKPWHECATMHDMNEIMKSKSGLAKGATQAPAYVPPSDVDNAAAAAHASKRSVYGAGICGALQSADLASVARQSSLFAGCEFCILTDGPQYSKRDVEQAVCAAGGRIVQHPLRSVTHYVADRSSARIMRVTSLIDAWRASRADAAATTTASATVGGKRKAASSVSVLAASATSPPELDIWTSAWVYECIAARTLLPLAPHRVVHTCPASAARLRRIADAFGDSYTAAADASTLARTLEQVDGKLPSVFRRGSSGGSGGGDSECGVDEARAAVIASVLASPPAASLLDAMDALFSADDQEALALHAHTALFPLLGSRIHFDRHTPGGGTPHAAASELDVVALQARARGATLVDTPADATHIVVADDHKSHVRPRLPELWRQQAAAAAAMRPCARLVTAQWLAHVARRADGDGDVDAAAFVPVLNAREERLRAQLRDS